MVILDNAVAYLSNADFLAGMYTGALALLTLVLLVWLFAALSFRCKELRIKDEGGDFVVSRQALLNFMRGTVNAVPGVSLKGVGLRRHGKKVIVDVSVAGQPEADLVSAYNTLRCDILEDVKKKLGLSGIIEAVNIRMVALPAAQNVKDSSSVMNFAQSHAPETEGEKIKVGFDGVSDPDSGK